MKKYLMSGAVALVLGGFIASCSHEEVDYTTYVADKVAAYQEVFVDAYGKIDPNQNWGFGSTTNAASRMTRAITIGSDEYSKFNNPTAAELAEAFSTDGLSDAIEVSSITAAWDTWSNDNNRYFKISTPGTYEVGASYYNNAWDKIKNIYVNATGNTTVKVMGLRYVNIFILQGNVTIENSSEFGGFVSVAPGATFTYHQSSVADNDRIRIYNRGTIKFTADSIDIGNNCALYNEGTVSAKKLGYSPADGSKSFFINMSDNSTLYASSMTINSTGNMLNQGRMMIAGETKVTQARCFWVNSGHYHTGSMTFMAKNEDWYNYCQLIVDHNIHFYDGEFKMMDGSYAEAATADFDNFHVIMGEGAGLYIKGNTEWDAQADADQNRISLKTGATKAYLKLGGMATIKKHKYGMVIGAGINYALNSFRILEGDNVVTQEELIARSDGTVPVYVFEGTPAASYDALTVVADTTHCGASWNGQGETQPDTDVIPIDQGETSEDQITVVTTKEHYETRELIEQGRVFCEDLGKISTNDLDFNDVVFDAYIYKVTQSTRTVITEDGVTVSDETVAGEPAYKTTIVLLAAGGTLPLSVAGSEVHNIMGGNSSTTIINTIENAEGSYGNSWVTQDPVVLGTDFTYQSIVEIPIYVQYSNGTTLLLEAEQGWAPHKILTPIGTKWAKERTKVDAAYTDFLKYVEYSEDCWNQNFVSANLYSHPKDTYQPLPMTAVTTLISTEGPATTYRGKGTSTTTGGYQGEDVLSRKLR